MAHIPGNYNFVNQENFAEYLKVIGVPADKAEQAASHVKTLTVAVDGNKVTIDGGHHSKPTVLVLGEEVEEQLPTGGAVKSTTQLNGNTLTVTTKTSSGKTGTRLYEFGEGGARVTLSGDSHSVVAKVTYKRA